MKVKYVVYAVLIIAFGTLVAYRISKNSEVGGAKGSAGAGAGAAGKGGPGAGGAGARGAAGGGMMRVNGIVVKEADFANTLALSGSIQANEQVQIRSEVSGLVRSISFKEGTNVSKGQVLLSIDDSELRAQLAQALTRQELADGTEKRAAQLLKKEAISQEEYDVAKSDLRTLQSGTQLIRAQLAKTQIKAPFSGRIGLRSISNGEYLTPTTIVANLVSVNPVKIQFSIPEKYSGLVKLNSEFTFQVSGSDKTYTGKVYAIEPGIEEATRTLQLRGLANNSNNELLPGSFVKVNFPLSDIKNAILIPTEAIIPVLKGRKVFIAENGKAKEVMVETSTRTSTSVLVTSGLKLGDTVLTTGVMSLKPDASVKVNVVK